MKKDYLTLKLAPIDVVVEGVVCGSNPAVQDTVDPLVNKNAEPTTLENFEINF